MDSNTNGLQGSPASFARLIDYVMRDLPNVITYIDNVLGHALDHKKQLVLLELMFKRLRKYNLKLNVAKSIFGASEVNYLGYTISGDGIKPGREKVSDARFFEENKRICWIGKLFPVLDTALFGKCYSVDQA